MEVLLKGVAGVSDAFLIKYDEKDISNSIEFEVEEITGWLTTGEISDTEPYLKAYIKWDGCGHFWFGDEEGYLHLCGKSCIENHINLIKNLWEIAENKITNYDKGVGACSGT